MALTTTTTAVTTAAALIGTPKASRSLLIITNPPGSGITVYIGGSTVASTNYDFLLAPGDPPLIISRAYPGDPDPSRGWYIRGSGSGNVFIGVEALA